MTDTPCICRGIASNNVMKSCLIAACTAAEIVTVLGFTDRLCGGKPFLLCCGMVSVLAIMT